MSSSISIDLMSISSFVVFLVASLKFIMSPV